MQQYKIQSGEQGLANRVQKMVFQHPYCAGAVGWKGRYTKCTCIQQLHKSLPPVLSIEFSTTVVVNYIMNLFSHLVETIISDSPNQFRINLLKHVNASRSHGVRSTPKLRFQCNFTIRNKINSPLLEECTYIDYLDNITICTHSLSYVFNFNKQEYNFYFDKNMLHDKCFKVLMVRLFISTTLSKVMEMDRYENIMNTRVNWQFVIDKLLHAGVVVNSKTIRQYYNNNYHHFKNIVCIPFSDKCTQLGFHTYFKLTKEHADWIKKYQPSFSNKKAWDSVSRYKYIQYTKPSSSYGSLNGFLGFTCNCYKIQRNDTTSIQIATAIDNLIAEKMNVGEINIHMGYMHTKAPSSFHASHPQDPHIDFSWSEIDAHAGKVYIGIISLDEDGSFIQVWQSDRGSLANKEGVLVHIPYRYVLIMPGNMIHAGGFNSNSITGNIRVHLYIYCSSININIEKTNTHTDCDGKPLIENHSHNRMIDHNGIFNCLI